MHPRLFWRTNPRKFDALCRVHAKLNGPADEKEKKQDTPANTLVGEPTVFIDQLIP